MDNELFRQKIRLLTDDKLKELLQLRTRGNHEIMELAEEEATERGISFDNIEPRTVDENKEKTKKDEGIDWMYQIALFLSESDAP